jgi:hypothetical protein
MRGSDLSVIPEGCHLHDLSVFEGTVPQFAEENMYFWLEVLK